MVDRKKVIDRLESAVMQMHGSGRYTPEDVDELEMAGWDALALLREQEPRVMTLDEVIHSKDWIWYQWKSTHCGWAIAVNCDGKWIEWEDSTTDQLCEYGKKWRCWTSRPTEEQIRDTPWEGDSDA